jgi:uncharacterized membrane protein
MKTPTYNPKSSNYNYKPKRSFKEKVKNFFNVDIEKDLQEEEGQKVFQRTKLFTLNRINLFVYLALFFVIVNILVGFNLNFLYIRQILGFLFLILIPGLLIMLCFKIRKVGFWEYLVYTIGLSVAFIMFAGLAVNWTLPLLGITDKPLSLYPILICFDIFLIILGVVAWKRNADLEHEFTTPKLDTLNNVFFIIPIAFPVLAVLGAFLLNNHGPNILTMIMLGGIAVYVLFLVIFRKKLNENIWPWAILMISISILLSGWMRSWFVSGPDISLEYWVFQLTKNNSFWALSNFNNAYNAMLSLNIFPTVLSHFININDQFIFKLIIPTIFGIVPLIIYLISKRILSPLFCFFAGVLFLSMPDFLNWYEIPIRQEIAFILFGLMILVLFTKQLSPILKKVLAVIFGASMIVSHYSTAYIALAVFTLTYIFISIYKIYENRRIKKGKLHPSQKSNFYLTGFLVLLLLLFGFLWYSQVTTTADGLFAFAGKSISNFKNILNEDTRQGGSTDPLFGFFNKPKIGDYINDYQVHLSSYDISNTSNGFSKESYLQYKITPLASSNLESKINILNIPGLNSLLKQIVTKIFQFFIIVGLWAMFINKSYDKNLKVIYSAIAFLILLFLFLPFFSIDYSLTRFILQMLIMLSPVSIFGGEVLSNKLKIKGIILISILLFLLFSLFSGLIPQIIGGDLAKTQLNNFGSEYDMYYMFPQDYFSAKEIDSFNYNVLYCETSACSKINSYAGRLNGEYLNKNVVPTTISKKGYVYVSTTNNLKNMGFFVIKSLKIGYNFPTEFLNDNKNKVYNNGGSEIFK